MMDTFLQTCRKHNPQTDSSGGLWASGDKMSVYRTTSVTLGREVASVGGRAGRGHQGGIGTLGLLLK